MKKRSAKGMIRKPAEEIDLSRRSPGKSMSIEQTPIKEILVQDVEEEIEEIFDEIEMKNRLKGDYFRERDFNKDLLLETSN
jgi:hypothetical protein